MKCTIRYFYEGIFYNFPKLSLFGNHLQFKKQKLKIKQKNSHNSILLESTLLLMFKIVVS